MAKMNDYPSVDNTEEFTQEQKAAFLDSAMCIATGSKTQNGAKVTANIPLSDINLVPTPAAAHADVGKVLTVQQASDPNDPDEIVWQVPQGGGGIPDPTGVTNGYVLTASNGAATWAAPAGGGSSPLIIPITGGLDFADDIQISSYITIPSGESALATFIEYCKNHLDTMFKLNYGTDIILFRLWSIDIDSSEMMSKVHFVGSNCGYASVIYDLTVQYSEGDDVGYIAGTIYNDHFYSNP